MRALIISGHEVGLSGLPGSLAEGAQVSIAEGQMQAEARLRDALVLNRDEALLRVRSSAASVEGLVCGEEARIRFNAYAMTFLGLIVGGWVS